MSYEIMPLPPLTGSIETAKQHLTEYGVARLTGVLTADELDELRTRVDQQAAAERRKGKANIDGGPRDAPETGPNQRGVSLIPIRWADLTRAE